MPEDCAKRKKQTPTESNNLGSSCYGEKKSRGKKGKRFKTVHLVAKRGVARAEIWHRVAIRNGGDLKRSTGLG